MYDSYSPARAAIVTCMDPRLQLPRVLGPAVEESYILRNAGGRGTEDVLRGLVVCTRLLEVTEVGVIHHTDCRMQKYTQEELILSTGVAIDYRAFTDPLVSILEDVHELANCSILNPQLRIWGGLYMIENHTVSIISDTRDWSPSRT